MPSVKKIVLVTAEHHPYHKLWVRMAEKISKELNVPLDVKIEDYVYVNEYGDKDEFGMAWLPKALLFIISRAFSSSGWRAWFKGN